VVSPFYYEDIKRMRRFILALTLVFTMVGLAAANTIPVGTPGATPGDWSQQFNESGVGNFDTVVVSMVTAGVDFAVPGQNGFSDGSYVNTDFGPDYSSATGNPTNNLNWNINFVPDLNVPLSFNFYAYLNENGVEVQVDSANASWNGNGWAIGTATVADPGGSVPEPLTLSLVGLGLLGLAYKRRIRS